MAGRTRGRIPPRAPEVQRRIMDADRLEIHTSLPARVVSYDRDTQTVEAQIMVRQVTPAQEDEDEDTVSDYPNLPSVPVAGMRIGNLVIHADLQPDEEIWICFAEADLNRWRETGTLSDPGVPTRHGLAGCWAVPGAFSRPRALTGLTDKPTIKVQGGAAIVWNGSALECGGSNVLAKGDPTDAQLAAIVADLATIATALGTKQTGTSTPPTLTAAGVRTGNPIKTSITKGA